MRVNSRHQIMQLLTDLIGMLLVHLLNDDMKNTLTTRLVFSFQRVPNTRRRWKDVLVNYFLRFLAININPIPENIPRMNVNRKSRASITPLIMRYFPKMPKANRKIDTKITQIISFIVDLIFTQPSCQRT